MNLLLCLLLADPTPKVEVAPSHVTLTGLSDGQLAAARDADGALTVRVASPDSDSENPPILGRVAVADGGVRFTPKFPFADGVSYELRLTIPGQEPITRPFALPKKDLGPPAEVEAVYPSGDRIPANLLRIYIHFTEPMSRRDSYRHIRILRADGTEVEVPFLPLPAELWDPEGKRMTVYIDPGRIKREVKPHEDLGPVLVPEERFTLVIDGDWEDVHGRPLKTGLRKEFLAVEPIMTAHNPDDWRIDTPKAGTQEPLKIRFPRPMDHALVRRMIEVLGPDGEPIAGEIATADAEQDWSFRPERPWQKGEHRLAIDTALEDPSGNRIDAAFEVDIFHPVQKSVKRHITERTFQVGSEED